jgi:hypothetical protein
MVTKVKASLWGTAALALLMSSTAQAWPTSDQGAALVIYPKVVYVDGVLETEMRLANLASQPTVAHCFYVNANSHCTNDGSVCDSSIDCLDPTNGSGTCRPGWIETNFDISLTNQQPIGWLASEGLSQADLPCVRTFANPNPCPPVFGPVGSNGSNAGTRVPPVSESPFIGELKCIQSDPSNRLPLQCGAGLCRNDLAGTASITGQSAGIIDVASYNAVGLRALINDNDNTLLIGESPAAGTAEYESCPEVLVADFFFDGAIDPISGSMVTSSELTLVPCTQDFRSQTLPPVTAQFLVYNEFEQRFSTSRQVSCLLDSPLSLIDTTQADRSIFNARVAGTIMGQARIRGINGGLVGALVLNMNDGSIGQGRAAYSLDTAVRRSATDTITLP